MGNRKLKWSGEEEEALKGGVAIHGTGKWTKILKDPQFSCLLYARSNIDLKDKWRNMTVAGVNLNPKEIPTVAVETVTRNPDVVVVESLEAAADRNETAKFNEMVFEAVSILNRASGSDFAAISDYIEQNHAPQFNFKRHLTRRLGRLVDQGKVEKVQKCFRLTNVVYPDPHAIQHHKPLHRVQRVMPVEDNTAEAAAISATDRIAEAENKSFVAVEAMKEAERVSSMAEEMDSLLQFATYCFGQSAQGELLLMV